MPEQSRTLFSSWLAGHSRGNVDAEMTAAMAEVVEAVAHLEKKGKVVLTFEVEPAGSGGRTVVVRGEVATKPPLPAAEASIFYVGDAGTLHRDDPFQGRMPLGEPARAVDNETGEVRHLEEGD